jgi:hypothetical protein
MKLFLYALTLAIVMSFPALAQNSAQQVQRPPQRAASATQDNRAISGDQVTKPAGAKSSTLIGCLSGPDSNGRYTLRSMEHRLGLQVLGPDDLKKDSGSKVKLTGWWIPGDQPATKGKETRKFQASEVAVLAQKCAAPNETTPISKEKQQQQQQKQQQQKSSGSAPASGEASNPK